MGRETGDAVGVDFGVTVGVAVDVGVAVGVSVSVGVGVDVGDGVGAGVTLALAAGDVGDGCVAGEICFCGDGVPLGVADCTVFDAVGVGDLRAPDGEDFAFGVGVGLGRGVCALRSTPR